MSEPQTSEQKRKQPHGKEYVAWGLFNWGNPWGTFRTRKDAIEKATDAVGEPWKKARTMFRVQKVKVTPYE